jgi:hypothetical protein
MSNPIAATGSVAEQGGLKLLLHFGNKRYRPGGVRGSGTGAHKSVKRLRTKRGFTVIIVETNNNETENSERRGLGEAPDEVPTQTIINFESGPKALKRPG